MNRDKDTGPMLDGIETQSASSDEEGASRWAKQTLSNPAISGLLDELVNVVHQDDGNTRECILNLQKEIEETSHIDSDFFRKTYLWAYKKQKDLDPESDLAITLGLLGRVCAKRERDEKKREQAREEAKLQAFLTLRKSASFPGYGARSGIKHLKLKAISSCGPFDTKHQRKEKTLPRTTTIRHLPPGGKLDPIEKEGKSG